MPFELPAQRCMASPSFVPSVLLTASCTALRGRCIGGASKIVPARSARVRCCATDEAAPVISETSSSATERAKDCAVEPPPSTFFQAITQAYAATVAALEAGERLLEVEFPPLSTEVLESATTGAYDVSDANIRLAVTYARRFADAGKRVCLSFPDMVEQERAEEANDGLSEPINGIRFGCIKDARRGLFLERIWTSPPIEPAVQDDDDIFVVLGASAQELPDVEKMIEAAGDRPVVLFNLKLDSSRGDLGLPAFPRRALHFRFLSRVLPVYYLRTRTYSRSTRKAPFVVNYSGALFRVYPGPYQVLLDGAGGRYRRLSTLEERPALGAVRDILTDGLSVEGVDGSNEKFMFKGYKSTTWWEDDRTQQISNKWRS